MPGAVHESIVALLCDHPEWLDALLVRTGHEPLPVGLRRIDSTQRLVDPVELRPDLLMAEGEKGPWVAIEIQLAKDLQKEIRWPLLSALLRSTRGEMGDILVVTAHEHVAEWARNLPMAVGPLGANLAFVPVVLHLRDEEARMFLDPARPELSFFAAWAMQDRHGKEARTVVELALDLAGTVPDLILRESLFSSIFLVVSDQLAATLRETFMNTQSIPKSPNELMLREAFEKRFGAEIEARGEVRGEAKMLLKILDARKLLVDDATRARILECSESAVLERWAERALTATTIDDVFSEG